MGTSGCKRTRSLLSSVTGRSWIGLGAVGSGPDQTVSFPMTSPTSTLGYPPWMISACANSLELLHQLCLGYVVMEVNSNLLPGDRKETLSKFTNPCYNKVAQIVMGEPDKDFKAMVQSKLLKEKQE